MINILLIDFGATNIKSIVVSKKNIFKKSIYTTNGSGTIGNEINNKFFSNSMKLHLKQASKKFKISSIVMCTEMHGFSYKIGKKISNYFSWRFSNGNELKVIKQVKRKKWFKDLNIIARPGLPLITVLNLRSIKKIQKKIKILFIPQIICENLGTSNNIVHASLGQASGLYFDRKHLRSWIKGEIELPIYSNDDKCCLGEIRYDNKNIPVYGGYGDLQASLYDIKKEVWNINIGTGSQIVIHSKHTLPEFEKRAFFRGDSINCLSHLPAGRSLNLIASLLKSIRNENNNDFFWKSIKSLEYNKLKNNNLIDINLSFFEQNLGYFDGGFFKNICEHNLTLENFLYSIVYAMASNYATIINQSKYKKTKINVYGDLPSEMPIFKSLLKKQTGLKVNVKTNNFAVTLFNMRKICLDYNMFSK